MIRVSQSERFETSMDILKDLFHVLLTSVGSVIYLFFLTKLLGNKQMSQLSMFDYINGITIGSIAAEMATALEDDFLNPMLGMAIYTATALLISFIASRSIRARKFLIGRPLILFDNGKLYRGNLKKAGLDLNEFLTECRNSGYFNIAQLQTAIFETNGKISFLPLSTQRPVTPADMSMDPPQEMVPTNVIIDGRVLGQNLQAIGKNEQWLLNQLKQQSFPDPAQVFLATVDQNDCLSVYIKLKDKDAAG